MIVGVTGPNGRLGSWLVRAGCVPIEADITKPDEVEKSIAEIGPNAIINCAAWTDVDGAEQTENLEAVLAVNLRGPRILRRLFDGHLVHISTGYIFDGENGPYSEDDEGNPINWYGWSKWGGELVVMVKEPYLIIRTLELFGPTTNGDFVRYVRDLTEIGATLELPETLYLTPTYIPFLAEALLETVEREITGILNLAGTLTMSRYEWGRKIAEHFGHDPDLIKPTSEVNGVAPRPLRGGLSVDKAIGLGLPMKSPLEGLIALSEWEDARKGKVAS